MIFTFQWFEVVKYGGGYLSGRYLLIFRPLSGVSEPRTPIPECVPFRLLVGKRDSALAIPNRPLGAGAGAGLDSVPTPGIPEFNMFDKNAHFSVCTVINGRLWSPRLAM